MLGSGIKGMHYIDNTLHLLEQLKLQDNNYGCPSSLPSSLPPSSPSSLPPSSPPLSGDPCPHISPVDCPASALVSVPVSWRLARLAPSQTELHSLCAAVGLFHNWKEGGREGGRESVSFINSVFVIIPVQHTCCHPAHHYQCLVMLELTCSAHPCKTVCSARGQ